MLTQLERQWNQLFEELTTSKGKELSKEERTRLKMSRSSLVYGEVSFKSLGQVLWSSQLQLPPGGIFYDLGSGTGRGCFAATLLHDFDKVIGIELLEGLCTASIDVVKKYDKEVRPSLKGRRRNQDIKMHRASFLEYDWSDGDLVFANSTCFDEQLIRDIAKLGERLKEGSYVVTLTKRLESPYFKLLSSKQYSMSWGYATVHVHQRQKPQEQPPEGGEPDRAGGGGGGGDGERGVRAVSSGASSSSAVLKLASPLAPV
jgi:SAM-dependent methyltransferase